MTHTMTESLARLLFALAFVPFAAMRIHYHRKAGKQQRPLVSQWEGKPFALFRALVAIPGLLILLSWLLWPEPIRFASFPLPDSLRWLGFALMLTGVALVFWVNRTLGRNFSATLALQDDHRLILEGPYRYVRHPMYSSFIVLILGMLLLSANWLVGGLPLFAVLLVMAIRTPREEAMLLDRFGEEYRRYMERTRRYLPRLSH